MVAIGGFHCVGNATSKQSYQEQKAEHDQAERHIFAAEAAETQECNSVYIPCYASSSFGCDRLKPKDN